MKHTTKDIWITVDGVEFDELLDAQEHEHLLKSLHSIIGTHPLSCPQVFGRVIQSNRGEILAYLEATK
jgi:hypothetical protein